jgi:hypothetical protein
MGESLNPTQHFVFQSFCQGRFDGHRKLPERKAVLQKKNTQNHRELREARQIM